jgi:2-polyprenyl-3-methyl-5-hydroxy-6-metoxy-1,4-benzoquinol methylase
MKYTRQDYLSDCANPEMVHIKDKERFKAFYNELGNDPVQKAQRLRRDLIEFITPKGRIIELGCHIGFNTIYFASQGFEVIGVDIAETLIAEARKLRSFARPAIQARVSFTTSDILDLDAEELGLFDTIILTETLEHVIDPLPILAKAKELLSDGGSIFVSAPSTRTGTYSHVRGVTVEDMQTMASSLSLRTEVVSAGPNTQVILRHLFW